MKSKMFLALLTSLALIAGLFAAMPFSASAANNIADEWKALNEGGTLITNGTPGEGYDSRIQANSNGNYTPVTKRAYDLKETTFVMANVSIASDWANLVFAKTPSGGLTGTNTANGTLSLLMRLEGDNLRLTTWAAGEGAFATVPKADKYEFGIVTAGGMTRLRINDTYVDTDFCANAGESYISLIAINSITADVKLVSNDTRRNEWLRFGGNSGGTKAFYSKVEADASGKAHLSVNSDMGASTMARFNLLENTLVISDYTFSGSWFNIAFGTERAVSLNLGSDVFGFIANPGQQVWTANGVHNTGAHTAGTYKIGFAKVGSEYRLYINDIIWTGDDVTAFCTSGAVESCYVSTYAAGGLTADFAVVDNTALGDWILTTGNTMNRNVDGDTTDTRRMVWSGLGVAARGAHDMTQEKLALKNTVVAANGDHWNAVTFAVDKASGFTSTATGSVCIFLVPTVTDGVSTEMRIVNFNNNWDWLGAVPAASDYVFRFVGVADDNGNVRYKLEVNGIRFDRDVFSSFCTDGYAKKCYVSLSTSNLFKTTPEFVAPTWETVKQKQYGAPVFSAGENGSCDAVIMRSSYMREKNTFAMNRFTFQVNSFTLPTDALTPNADDNPNDYGCSMAIVLAKNPQVVESVVATSEQLTFAVRKLTDHKGISVHVVNAGGGWESLGAIDYAETYTFDVVRSVAGNYLLRVNGTVLSANNAINTFFAGGAQNTYVLAGSHKTTVTANLKAESTAAALGDLNGDQDFDIRDLIGVSETNAYGYSADCNGDGTVDNKDTAQLQKYLLGVDGAYLGWS